MAVQYENERMIVSITTSLQTAEEKHEPVLLKVLEAFSGDFLPLHVDNTGPYYKIIHPTLNNQISLMLVQLKMNNIVESIQALAFVKLTNITIIDSVPSHVISLSALWEKNYRDIFSTEYITTQFRQRIDNITSFQKMCQNEKTPSSPDQPKSEVSSSEIVRQIHNDLHVQKTYFAYLRNLNGLFIPGNINSNLIHKAFRNDCCSSITFQVDSQEISIESHQNSVIKPSIQDKVRVVFQVDKSCSDLCGFDKAWFLNYYADCIHEYFRNKIFDDFYRPAINVIYCDKVFQIAISMQFAVVPSAREDFHDKIFDLIWVTGLDRFLVQVRVEHQFAPFLLFRKPKPTPVLNNDRRPSIFVQNKPVVVISTPMIDAGEQASKPVFQHNP